MTDNWVCVRTRSNVSVRIMSAEVTFPANLLIFHPSPSNHSRPSCHPQRSTCCQVDEARRDGGNGLKLPLFFLIDHERVAWATLSSNAAHANVYES